MIEMLQDTTFSGLQGLKHGFFTRQGGVSEGVFASLNCSPTSTDDMPHIVQNRARVAETFGVPANKILTCYQIHASNVITVEDMWPLEKSPHADAIVTNKKGVAIGVLTADCVPVLLADPVNGVIGVAHAGWRGAVAGVVDNAITEMELLGAVREQIHAALGPCILQDSYEVGADLCVVYMEKDENASRFFVESENPDHFMFDLPAYVRARTLALGIASCGMPLANTCEDERFFSYRRNCLAGKKRVGGQISLLMLT